MKGLIWTPIALKSLHDTIDFLQIQWHESIVDSFVESIEHKLALVQENTEIGPKIGIGEIRRVLAHAHISLFYEDQVNYIKVLLVWDNRQNPDQLFEKLVAY